MEKSMGTISQLKECHMDTITEIAGSEDVQKLREDVFSICSKASSLGNLIDYLKEDAEAMAKEHEYWCEDQKIHVGKLDDEKRITVEMLDDESGELIRLEQEMTYQKKKITSLKAELLENEEKITKFLRMIMEVSS